MRYKFRITLKQQLLVLFPFISINTFIGLGFLYIAHGSHMNGVFLGLILFIALVNVFPTVVLHLQYLIRNGGAIFLIDVENNNMKYKKGKDSHEYFFDDIATIKYYATGGHISKKGSSLWYTFDPYRFYKIILKDGLVIIITCLMVNNIENTLENLLGKTAERKFRVLPLIY